MIKSVHITQKVIKAHVTSGARKTVVSIKSNNRVKAAMIGIRGLKGDTGDDSSNALVFGEIPLGLVNGSNATFTSAFEFVPESLQAIINGLYQRRGTDFYTSGQQTIFFTDSPEIGDSIQINYLRG